MRDVHVLRYDVQCTYILLSKFECKIEVCARESEDGVNLHFAHIIVTLTNLQYPTKAIVSWQVQCGGCGGVKITPSFNDIHN